MILIGAEDSVYITSLDEITLNIDDDMLDAMLDECQIQDDTFDKVLDQLDDKFLDVLKDCNNEDFSSITKEKLESKLPDIKNRNIASIAVQAQKQSFLNDSFNPFHAKPLPLIENLATKCLKPKLTREEGKKAET